MVHGWLLSFAPRARKCVSDGIPSARIGGSQPHHLVWASESTLSSRIAKIRAGQVSGERRFGLTEPFLMKGLDHDRLRSRRRDRSLAPGQVAYWHQPH
jgi:hypothetical protein